MKPEYTANKSAIGSGGIFLSILFCWLIIPIFIMIYKIAYAKKYKIEFYNEKIIMKYGVINYHEEQKAFPKVLSVSMSQSLLGKIFNYGNVRVNLVGKLDFELDAIKKPTELKKYLESKITDLSFTTQIITD